MSDKLNDKSGDKPYFEQHVFFCMNQREDGRPSCGHRGAEAAQKHAKRCVKDLGLSGPGKVRINQAGCLDRCEEGPVVVVYPEGTWYTYVDNSDIDDIVNEHLVGGKPVERLKI
jgi:(2Fe-2S) ferredoxin